MRLHETKNWKQIKIPENAKDWELYSGDGRSNLAATNMTKRLISTFKLIEKYVDKGKSIPDASRVAAKRLHQTMDKYTHVGASDSEPRARAGDAGRLFVCARYGLELYGETAEAVYDAFRWGS